MDHTMSRRNFAMRLAGAISGAALLNLRTPFAFAQGSAPLAELLANELNGLAGEIIADEISRTHYADDYGKIVRHTPAAVLIPREAADIVKLLKFANKQSLKVGVRGMGHSFLGQAQIQKGVLVDMAALDSVKVIDNATVEVGAGSTWGPVMHEANEIKRTLPVVNDTFLSVGGSLSTGGFGATTWNKGFMIDHVRELEVVTGAGELVTCSDEKNADLFNAVLAGMGQCGIITKARMELAAAPTHVLFIKLVYNDDVQRASEDLGFLAKDGRFNHLDLRSKALPFGGFEYYVEGGLFYGGADAPKTETFLEGLHFASQSSKILTHDEYFSREETCYSCIDVPKPSLYLTLPASRYPEYIKKVLNTPAESAYISPRMSAWLRKGLKRPLARVADEDLIFRTQINRVLPNAADIPAFLAINRSLYEQARDLGGTRLTTSAIPFTPEDWVRHYGPAWEPFKAAKRKYDPNTVLGSAHNMFPA